MYLTARPARHLGEKEHDDRKCHTGVLGVGKVGSPIDDGRWKESGGGGGGGGMRSCNFFLRWMRWDEMAGGGIERIDRVG